MKNNPVDSLKLGKVLGGSKRRFANIEAMIKNDIGVSKRDRDWYNKMKIEQNRTK